MRHERSSCSLSVDACRLRKADCLLCFKQFLFIFDGKEKVGSLQGRPQRHIDDNGYDRGSHRIDGSGCDVPCQGHIGGGSAQDQPLVEVADEWIEDNVEQKSAGRCGDGPF